jgi:hypothetical protein
VSFSRLPETVHTLYAELLDQLRIADAEAATRGVAGTFVSKQIKGKRYWYVQRNEGGAKRQLYLGPETPELLAKIETTVVESALAAEDVSRRRELVTMLAAGGMHRESATIATVIRVLSDAGVFRGGGVLVGTQAFTTIANLLGVRFDKETLRTADVDVAHNMTIPVGVDEKVDILEKLRSVEPRFVAVPGFDAREASTSLKVRGRELRVDFLTPARKRGQRKPLLLTHLGIAALPLEGLGYLIDEAIDAAFVGGEGTYVNVPQPARFALHKLWVASQRPVSEAAKARKDVRQATSILDVLLLDRPDDLTRAWRELGSLSSKVRAAARRLPREIGDELLGIDAGSR